MEGFSADMRELSGNNKESIAAIVNNFESASGQLNTTLASMNAILGEIESGQGPLAKIVRDEEMGEDLKRTVAQLESVSRKIDEGKGTLGKLVNDDTTGKELDKALEGVNTFLARQETLKTNVDFRSELYSTGDVKSYLNLELQPSEDKYYLLGIVDDPKGKTETTEKTITRRTGGNVTVTEIEEEETEKDGLKFNAQIAKRWGDVALRGGIFESTGGAAVDYYLWDDRAKLYLEAFDFQDDEEPHLKSGVMLYFLKNFYATAGFDDFIGNEDDRAFFGGLGLRFTDDDLKYLISGAPIPDTN
jgi:phospholipid/cholesterol/gamma-HCH transport system substrate-binding protein